MREGKLLLILMFFALGVGISTSCKKEITNVYLTGLGDSSYLSITNASPAISNLLFYIGNKEILLPDTPLAYGNTTFTSYTYSGNAIHPTTDTLPYIRIPSGFQQLNFSAPNFNRYFVSFSNYFVPGAYYSVFVTDTATHGQLAYVFMQDEIGQSDTSQALLRFLNLSPGAPPMDLWAFPDVQPNGFKVYSNSAYVPNNISASQMIDTFAGIKPAPYLFVATQAGTYNVILDGGLVVRGNSVSTVYSLGYMNGLGPYLINVAVIQYNQQH